MHNNIYSKVADGFLIPDGLHSVQNSTPTKIFLTVLQCRSMVVDYRKDTPTEDMK